MFFSIINISNLPGLDDFFTFMPRHQCSVLVKSHPLTEVTFIMIDVNVFLSLLAAIIIIFPAFFELELWDFDTI